MVIFILVGASTVISGIITYSTLNDYIEERLEYTLENAEDNAEFMDSWNTMQTAVILPKKRNAFEVKS